MNFFKIFFLILIIFLSSQVYGASVYFDIPKEIFIDEVFPVVVYINTDDTQVNSFSFDINYDNTSLDFVGYKEDETIIKIFIDKPHSVDNHVLFTGIIPGGISNFYDPSSTNKLKDIPIITLLFKPKNTGPTNLSFSKGEILKNDGLGTSLFYSVTDKSFVILEKSLEAVKSKAIFEDKEKPLPFEILNVEKNDDLKTPNLLYFSTQDLDSGIKKYQMKINNGKWTDVESPKVIYPSFFDRDFTIRAVDFSGNFKDSTLKIKGNISWKIVIIICISILVALYFYNLLRCNNGKNTEN